MAIRFANPAGGLLRGTNGWDGLWGDRGRDHIEGLGGTDYIHGVDGDDRLDGGSAVDYLKGDGGVDVLVGGSESDLLRGGSEADYFVFRAADGRATDVVEDFVAGVDRLVLGGGLSVDRGGRSVLHDFNLDGHDDTVLTLSNGTTVVLVGVGQAQDWSIAGPNVMRPPEMEAALDLLA